MLNQIFKDNCKLLLCRDIEQLPTIAYFLDNSVDDQILINQEIPGIGSDEIILNIDYIKRLYIKLEELGLYDSPELD